MSDSIRCSTRRPVNSPSRAEVDLEEEEIRGQDLREFSKERNELTICHEIKRISRLETKSKDSSSVVVRHREISKVVEHPRVLNDRRSTLRTEDQASVGLKRTEKRDEVSDAFVD